MTNDEKKIKLIDLLNEIVTYLWEGEIWHGKTANESRKFSMRGFGRWHELEAFDDMQSRVNLEKIIRDRMNLSTFVDHSKIINAFSYTIKNMNDFNNHFMVWHKREIMYSECLNEAFSLSRHFDIQLYKSLCEVLDLAQEEIMRVKIVFETLQMYPNDIRQISEKLHLHFEKNNNLNFCIS